MIIARITGGIGNQLFQYAFARSLALKLDIKFKMDLSWYRNYDKYEDPKNPNAATKREYLLDKFNITENIINQNYFRVSHRINNSHYFKNIINFPPFRYFQYNTVTKLNFNLNNINSFRNVYLNGFWQKSDLFEEYPEIIKEEFSLKNKLSIENEILLDKIELANSVAVHIRRGDLLSRPAAAAEQPSSSDKYYFNAINIIKEKVEKPEIFIFSDNIDWVKNYYNFDIKTTHIDNAGPDYEHFNLMCRCKHQIITNSTFSWWAAWLNSYQYKIIISPKWWYRDPVNNESIIRIPQKWVILENMEN